MKVEGVPADDPVPLSGTVCGEPVTLSAIDRVAVRAPPASGVKVTVIEQVPLAATLAARGYYSFGLDPGSDAVAIEGHLPGFRPLPVLDLYFDRILALLESRGVEARFLTMPVNEATWTRIDPAAREGFRAWLGGYAARYPMFHVVDDLPAWWPDRYFGDAFCHLNPAGAERFSALLALRLQAAPPSTQNEAQNGWLSGTGRDASASVAPISKRGS